MYGARAMYYCAAARGSIITRICPSSPLMPLSHHSGSSPFSSICSIFFSRLAIKREGEVPGIGWAGTLTGFEGGFAVHGQSAPKQALCAAHQTQWRKGWRQWARTVSGHKSSQTRWVGAYSSVNAHPKYFVHPKWHGRALAQLHSSLFM